MLIAGFDCALLDFGICYVKYNEDWRKQMREATEKLGALLDSADKYAGKGGKDKFVKDLTKHLDDINDFTDNIISIVYCNVVDLSVGYKTPKDIPLWVKSNRLKQVLNSLDDQFKPDIVLVEYQMKVNDLSRTVSSQIVYHYANCQAVAYKHEDIKKSEKTKKRKSKDYKKLNYVSYAMAGFPLLSCEPRDRCPKFVTTVGTGLKLNYHFCEEGAYRNFIVKYSNYVANKKHTDWNFRYFVNIFGGDKKEDLLPGKNKADDAADAFMMIFGWIRKNNL